MAFPLLTLSLLFFFHLVQGNPELRALMELKSSLDPDGHYLSSWTPGGDPCRGHFEGVACNEHGKVANISLQGKGLSGSISPSVKELRCLSGLYLHYNALRGEIPKEIANLTELTDLYLNVNNLSGGIPSEIGNMASLQVLQLCYNRLTGSIPTQLGILSKLSVLALQSNQLTGAIPASLGDLPELVRLDLSFNKFFGSIPRKLALLPQLLVLDVRNNSLSGDVPTDLQRLSKGFQFANNKGLCGIGFSSLQTCTSADLLNPNRPEPYGPNASAGLLPREIPQSADLSRNCKGSRCSNGSKSSAIVVIIVVIVVSIGGLISGLLVFVWYRRRKQKIGSALELSDSRLSIDQPKEVFRKSASPLINLDYSNGWDPLAEGGSSNEFSQEVQSFRFNLEEVECATQYFSEVNLLGKSNFVSTYKGMLRDGSLVAVKSITKTSCKTEEAEFLKGLKALTVLRHENLVGLKGFCCSRGRGECFLLYDFVANGSLSNYLDAKDDEKEKILDWSTRVSIIKGIAKGIEYLHSSRVNKPALVHQSISADKILIDQAFVPKLSAAGLHKLLADDVVFSTLKASAAMGYLAPEYTTTGRFTEKSDVYSFGVIMFQILTGKTKVTHLRLTADSGQLDDLIDKKLSKCFSIPEAAKLAGIALICTSEIPGQRPTMEAVLQELGSN
ncbi:probable leucine-rich repeat receptor-like protein kinase At5g63930 [Dendrobium catenatum]|uniref:LRR receptor-like serine/threonine-protein kinase GSO2 n=1 Tax=Dendrobium catenatum TaxID=906689 RepID=A0A2I0WI54_9ASPA|nr:probable leucine-rich repeat receptor-like protein kinase At5g63930 [Dendrobium catenatum]PKU75337.1 LRR receptor-like serine/threonine-protein kinase GSO2 [Dendrobium catenatum]